MKTPALFTTLSLAALIGCGGSSHSSAYFVDSATSVAVTNLTPSGHLDVVTTFDRDYGTGYHEGFASARLGQGGSGIHFGTPVDSQGGHAPGPMTVADLDNDGQPDLILSNATDTTVTILYGKVSPAGGFGSAVNLPLGSGRYAYATAVADFNGDGKLDIAVAASGGNDVLLFLQNAGGGFSGVTPTSIAVGATPYSIATGVLEPGGHQDLAVGLNGGQLAILTGNNDGTFQTPVDLACGTTPVSIKIADLDGANGPDIAVADYGSSAANGKVWIFLNGGAGTFAAGVSYDAGDVGTLDLAIGDLNNDGVPDIALANYGAPGDPGSLAVLINNGSGVLGAATLYGGLQGPSSVAIGDVDGDGKNDLISADGVGVIHLQDPANAGQFLAPVQLYY